jgi:hypothetical protein
MRDAYPLSGIRRLAALTAISGLLVAGCGPRYVIPSSEGKPAQVVVSAYTQSGCIESLQEFARENNFEARLLKVDTDLGWQIFLFPFYKGYRCLGESTGPAR